MSNGTVIAEGTPVAELVIPGGVAELELHPDAVASLGAAAGTPAPDAAPVVVQ